MTRVRARLAPTELLARARDQRRTLPEGSHHLASDIDALKRIGRP